MTMNNLTPASLLAMLMLASPLASALPTVPPPCVPFEEVTQTPWVETSGGLVSTVSVRGTSCEAGAGGTGGTASGQGDWAIDCTVTVSKKVHDEGWSVNLLFFTIHSRTVTTDVNSHLECGGSVTVTTTFTGGLGPRVGSAAVGSVGFGTNSIQDRETGTQVDVPAGDGCPYDNIFATSCLDPSEAGASFEANFHNLIPTSVDACAPVKWHNDSALAPTVDSDSGSFNLCKNGIPVREISDEALKALL